MSQSGANESSVLKEEGTTQGPQRKNAGKDEENQQAENDEQKLHPCLRVYGTCNYANKENGGADEGEKREVTGTHGISGCIFEKAPYDACLQYLKGHCPRGRACTERHVKYFEGAYVNVTSGKTKQNGNGKVKKAENARSSDDENSTNEVKHKDGAEGEGKQKHSHANPDQKTAETEQNDASSSHKYHPCIRVYGKCNFENAEEPCVYKDAPYNACLQYLKGHCPRGRNCTERHVRQIQRGLYVDVVPRAAATAIAAPPVDHSGQAVPTERHHPCIRVFGKCNYNGGTGSDGERHPCVYAKAPYDACLQYLKGHCPRGRNCSEQHVVWLANKGIYVCASTPGDGSVAPLNNNSNNNNNQFYTHGNKGFYAGVKGQHQEAYNGKKHPCLRVYGKCNFENASEPCIFKDAPFDSCLQFLKGHCMRGASCKELHCDPHTFLPVQATQYNGGQGQRIGGGRGAGGRGSGGAGGGGGVSGVSGVSGGHGSSGGGPGRQDRSGVLVPDSQGGKRF